MAYSKISLDEERKMLRDEGKKIKFVQLHFERRQVASNLLCKILMLISNTVQRGPPLIHMNDQALPSKLVLHKGVRDFHSALNV